MRGCGDAGMREREGSGWRRGSSGPGCELAPRSAGQRVRRILTSRMTAVPPCGAAGPGSGSATGMSGTSGARGSPILAPTQRSSPPSARPCGGGSRSSLCAPALHRRAARSHISSADPRPAAPPRAPCPRPPARAAPAAGPAARTPRGPPVRGGGTGGLPGPRATCSALAAPTSLAKSGGRGLPAGARGPTVGPRHSCRGGWPRAHRDADGRGGGWGPPGLCPGPHQGPADPRPLPLGAGVRRALSALCRPVLPASLPLPSSTRGRQLP